MKLTVVPAQTMTASADMVTLTGNIGLTLIVTALDVAGPPLWHVSLEVSTTVIISPFVGTYEYVGLLVPTAVAPLYHW